MEPTGVPARIDITIPAIAHITDIITEQTVTLKNVLNILIADNAGNIINADISKEPTRFMASTAIIRLHICVFIPVALANVSSNVTQNILL